MNRNKIYIERDLHLSAHVYLKASVPEASWLKPSAFAYCWQDFFLSNRRLPFFDKKFSCQWKQHAFGSRCTDGKSSCPSMNLVIFYLIFCFFGITDRKNTCQQYKRPTISFYFLWLLTDVSPVRWDANAMVDRHLVCQWTKPSLLAITDRRFVCQTYKHVCLTNVLSVIGRLF